MGILVLTASYSASTEVFGVSHGVSQKQARPENWIPSRQCLDGQNRKLACVKKGGFWVVVQMRMNLIAVTRMAVDKVASGKISFLISLYRQSGFAQPGIGNNDTCIHWRVQYVKPVVCVSKSRFASLLRQLTRGSKLHQAR